MLSLFSLSLFCFLILHPTHIFSHLSSFSQSGNYEKSYRMVHSRMSVWELTHACFKIYLLFILSGGTFCAGYDLAEVQQATAEDMYQLLKKEGPMVRQLCWIFCLYSQKPLCGQYSVWPHCVCKRPGYAWKRSRYTRKRPWSADV